MGSFGREGRASHSILLWWTFLFASGLFSTAWIPPRPNSTIEWEPVQERRRRLNITFDYAPSLMHPEACRHMTEAECRDMDEGMRQLGKTHRELIRHIQCDPNLGKFRILVLLMRFTDHKDRKLVNRSQIQNFWDFHMKSWFDANAQGEYDMEPVVLDWMDTDNTEIHYAFDSQGRDPRYSNAITPLLDKLDQDPSWDWSLFDVNKDNKLDGVFVMHSGYGAETQETDCFGRAWQNRIWSHAFAKTVPLWKSSRTGQPVTYSGYATASALAGSCGTDIPPIGLSCHEYSHTFGLPDLYDLKNSTGTVSGVGDYDVMANPWGPKEDAVIPGHLSAWSKQQLGWNDIKEIPGDGLYTLDAAETTRQAFKITLQESAYPEYLLIENRQQLAFDVDIFNNGLIIYHIDDLANLQQNRGYPGQPGWPQNGNHFQVAVLQKDGNYDLEKDVNNGDAGDFWTPGDTLGPGQGNTVFPNTDSYQLGNIKETGIKLEVLSQNGTKVTFRIGGIGTPGQPVTFNDDYTPSDSTQSGSGSGSGSKVPGAAPTSGTPQGFWSLSRAPVGARGDLTPLYQPPPGDDASSIAVWQSYQSSTNCRNYWMMTATLTTACFILLT